MVRNICIQNILKDVLPFEQQPPSIYGKLYYVQFPYLWYGVHAVVTLHQFIFGGHAVLSFPHSCKKQHTESKKTLSQNDLTSSHSSCEKPSSSGLELLLQRNYYPQC